MFQVIELGHCITHAMADLPDVVLPIEWICAEQLNVRVDPLHAQRAVASRVRVVVANDSIKHPGALTITQKAPAIQKCAVCDVPPRLEGDWVYLRTSGIRRFDPDLLRDPLESVGGGRTSRRLALAVLNRCAHRAAAHVCLDQPADLLTLVMPIDC